jgi:hypothetical protein
VVESEPVPVRVIVTPGTGSRFGFEQYSTWPEMLTVPAVIVMLPGGVLLGASLFRSTSKKIKSLGGAAQTNGVLAPGVVLTLVMFRVKSVPVPDNGVDPSLEKAEMRSVFTVPGPLFSTLPETFQLFAVSPAGATGGLWKFTTLESKVKSPWNPIRLSAGAIIEAVTGSVKVVTDALTLVTGRDIVTFTVGVGVGVGVGAGVGVGVEVGEGLGVAVGAGDGVGVGLGVGVDVGGSSSVIVATLAALPRKGSP